MGIYASKSKIKLQTQLCISFVEQLCKKKLLRSILGGQVLEVANNGNLHDIHQYMHLVFSRNREDP